MRKVRRYPSPPRERVRSPLTKLLSVESLQAATLANLLRLAEFLGIDTSYRYQESDDAYRDRMVSAIRHWERLYRRNG